MSKKHVTSRLLAKDRLINDITPRTPTPKPQLTGEECNSRSECDFQSSPSVPLHIQESMRASLRGQPSDDDCCTESDFCDKVDRNRTILDDARAIVEGQRRSDYGDARTCFNRIAKMWGGYLGMELNAQDVAHLMIMLKVARNHDTFKRDSLVDVCGYAYCADLIHDQELAATSRFNGEY